MNRKIYWGLAVLIVLLIGATVFVVIKDQAEMRQLEKEFAEAEKPVKVRDKPSQPIADNRLPPPGKSFEGGGHWHDGEWHDAPHDTPTAPTVSKSSRYKILDGGYKQESAVLPIPAGVGKDWASMTADEIAETIRAIELREEHAPEGYVYRVRESHQTHVVLWLDENGYPILKKEGEPSFGIVWGTGFRPTPEEYAEYKELVAQYAEVRAQTTSSPELDRLSAEIKKFKESHTGEVPHFVGISYSIPGHVDKDAYLSRARRISGQLLEDAYRKAGLAYMLDYIQP